MDNATITEVHSDGKITVEYDDEYTKYTTWDPLQPTRTWRGIEVGLDNPEDIEKPKCTDGDSSNDSSDYDAFK